jgi:hypothetical protein
MLLIGLIAKAQTPKQNPNQSDSEPTAFCWPSWSSLVFLRDVTWEGQTARHARLVAGATLSASAAAGKPAVLIMKHFNRVETWRRHLMNRSLMPCPRRREDRQTVAVYGRNTLRTKISNDVLCTSLCVVVQMLWNERRAVWCEQFDLNFSTRSLQQFLLRRLAWSSSRHPFHPQ